MASNPPYIPNLPVEIRKDFLNQWSATAVPTPTWPVSIPTASTPVQGVSSPKRQDADPVAGIWITSGGTWQFTKHENGYAVVESSAFGQTGSGVASFDGSTLSVDFTSALLGRMSITLALSDGLLQGTMPVWGIAVPFFLTRA